MSFFQPMDFDSAFRPVNAEHPLHAPSANGVANRSQLCRGNDAKCCRRAGQKARPVGDGANLVWDENAFGCGCHPVCTCCGNAQEQCSCQQGQEQYSDCVQDPCQPCRKHYPAEADNGCLQPEPPCPARRCREARNDSGCAEHAARCRTCQDHCTTCPDNGNDAETAGMVYPVQQCLEHVYCAKQALQAGTMYHDLYKPMNCADDPAPICASERQQKAFQLWELRLYLDTHPCDQKVLRLYRQLAAELDCPNYASTFDEASCDDDSWNWVSDPWPWECRFRRDEH